MEKTVTKMRNWKHNGDSCRLSLLELMPCRELYLFRRKESKGTVPRKSPPRRRRNGDRKLTKVRESAPGESYEVCCPQDDQQYQQELCELSAEERHAAMLNMVANPEAWDK